MYPAVIRKSERKPLRVFLQDGTNDLDNPHGNWPWPTRKWPRRSSSRATTTVRVRRRRPHAQSRRRNSARLAALAVACRTSTEPSPRSTLGPDSQVQADVPHGKVAKYTWTGIVYPGATHDYWEYMPKRYDVKAGGGDGVSGWRRVVREGGDWRVPVVFGDLIHKGEMQVTIGVFVNPGVVPPARESALPASTAASSTTMSATGTRGSCWTRSCRRWPRAPTSPPTRISAPSAAPVPAPSRRLRPPGTARTPSGASSAPSALTWGCGGPPVAAARAQVRT